MCKGENEIEMGVTFLGLVGMVISINMIMMRGLRDDIVMIERDWRGKGWWRCYEPYREGMGNGGGNWQDHCKRRLRPLQRGRSETIAIPGNIHGGMTILTLCDRLRRLPWRALPCWRVCQNPLRLPTASRQCKCASLHWRL